MKKFYVFMLFLSILLGPLAGIGSGEMKGLEPGEDNSLFINLKAAKFDPLLSEPNIPNDLVYESYSRYHLVQMKGQIQEEWIFKIADLNGIILGYVPKHTYIVYMEKSAKNDILRLPYVRWIGAYQPAYKIEKGLLALSGTVSLNIMVFEPARDHRNLYLVKDAIESLQGTILKVELEANIIVATIDASKIQSIAFIPEVEWIDEYSEPISLMDNIRVFTGAQSPLFEFGFNGTGIVGEVKDNGIDQDHVEFVGQLIDTDGSVSEESHGSSTFGIVFAKGAAPRAEGMLPGGKGVFCDWGVGRIASISNLVNNWDGLFQSNSWSTGSSDSSYTTVSQQNDQAIFDYDVSMLYASGNGGGEGQITRDATAKNVITVGALNHYDNQDRTDDQHTGSQGNQGPTDDGRIKPDLVGAYDSIYTTTSGGGYTSGFGGTSGATPIVAGGAGLVYEMYKRNHFGNNPSGTIPHAATVKALLIANAYQYEFSQGDRMAQGWGLVDVGNIYLIGENHKIVDESSSLKTGESDLYTIKPTTIHNLKISLVWTDVPGTTSSSQHLVNDLNLKVTDPAGTIYWGNYGLDTAKWSTSGGSEDALNNVENVFIETPIIGEWKVEVIAENIALDGNENTAQIDQNYALVASGVISSDHDMMVRNIEDLPSYFRLHNEAVVNGTVTNIGFMDETNVIVNLLENGVVVDTQVVDFIGSGTTLPVSLSWIPAMERTSELTLEIVKVSGENRVSNNKMTMSVDIFTPKGQVLVDDAHGNDKNLGVFYQHLHSMRYPVTYLNSEITSGLLGHYNILIIAGASSGYTPEELAAISGFVENGGGLFVVGDNDASIYNSLTDYAGISWTSPRGIGGSIDDINSHNITEGVSSLYLASPLLVLEVMLPAIEIAYDSDIILNRPLIAASEYSNGRIVALSDDNCLDDENLNSSDNRLFGENVILWLNSNQPPIAIIDFPKDGSVHYVNMQIEFNGGSSYDPDGFITDFLWASDVSGIIGTTQAFSAQLSTGDHQISLTVTDNGQRISTASVNITISLPNPPSVSMVSPGHESKVNGQTVISGVAADSDGFISRVEVRIGGGIWELASGLESWSLQWDTTQNFDGDWDIEARAFDNDEIVSEIAKSSVYVDNTPPMVLNGPKVDSITQNTARITWETNEPGDCLVEYGEDKSYGLTETKTTLTTLHEIVLGNLKPETQYHYKVITKDALGNSQYTQGDKVFTTAKEPDITPPFVQITSPRDNDTVRNGVYIAVKATDESGIDYVEFYIDGKLKFTDSKSSYSWIWNTDSDQYPEGQHRIKVVAFDARGNSQENEITVILDNLKQPPEIIKQTASPNSVDTHELTEVLFTVTVSDPESSIISIRLDLSSLGRPSGQKMYDDGTHGDVEPKDNIYSYETIITSSVDLGEKTVTVTVEYEEGDSIQSQINFMVFSSETNNGQGGQTPITLLTILMIIVFAVLLVCGLLAIAFLGRKRKRNRVMVPVAQPVYYQPQHVHPQNQTVYYNQYHKM